LTDSGILYEKAMALKQASGIRTSTVSASSILSSSSFIKSPRLPQPVRRPDSNSSLSNQSPTTSPSPITDWPYAFQKNDSSSFVANTSARSSLAETSSTNSSTLGGHSSSSSSDALSEWSPLLAPKRQQSSHQQDQENDRPSIYDHKWSPGGKKLETTSLEQHESTILPLRASKPVLSTIDTMHPSFFNSQHPHSLPRLGSEPKLAEDLVSLPTPDDPKSSSNATALDTNMGLDTKPPTLPIKYNRRMSNSTPTGHRYSPLLSPLPSPKSLSRSSNRSSSPPCRAWPPSPAANSKSNYSQFLNPHDGVGLPEYLSDHSDGSGSSHAEPGHLTEAAMNRRRRASAARAAKDKVAAETVDFDLMQDVQAWLRTLRLHKYAYAFEGLSWQEVVRMTDDDMTQAGVNTIGARRKLLKVFENVMDHCQKNASICSMPNQNMLFVLQLTYISLTGHTLLTKHTSALLTFPPFLSFNA
jgi:SAM domain (Sterile alpha motif)